MGWVNVTFAVIAFIVLLIVLFWRCWFLRLPARNIPKKGIVSPAYGRVVKIINFSGTSVRVPKGMRGIVNTLTSDVAKTGSVIVTMLTPLDVHYQRSPVDGVVEKITYRKGKFKNAVFGAGKLAGIENEKNEILIKFGSQRVKVVQVAGAAARRIECYVKKGQKVKKGEVIGLINFGSQVLLVLPKKKLKIKNGQRVVDGETVIA